MIYKFDDYREFISSWIEEKRQSGTPMTYQALAGAIQVQKSYLSKVMNRQAELSSDQGFLLEELLGLDEKESTYLQLLISKERTGLSSRKKSLHRKIREIQKEQLTAGKVLSKDISSSNKSFEYYSNPLMSIVHVSSLVLKTREKVLKILPAALGVDTGEIERILKNLTDLGILSNAEQIKNLAPDLHLDRNHPLARVHHALMREFSNSRIWQLNFDDSYTFSVTFSADEKAFSEIKNEYLLFLKKVEKAVKAASSQNSYQINFDLFPWLRT